MAHEGRATRFTRRKALVGLGALAALPIIQACGQPAASPAGAPKADTAAKPAADAKPAAASQASQPQAPAAQGQVEIRVMDRLAPNYSDFMNKWVEQFNQKQPRIKVVYEPRPADWTQKLTAAMAAGAAPDVPALLGEWFRAYMEKGQIRPLDEYIASSMPAEEVSDFWKGQYDGMNYQGKQLAIPYYINVNAAYYDTGALQEAGLSKPDDNWAPDQFLSYAQTLTKRSGDTVTRYGLATDYPQYFRRPISFVWELCGQINDPADIRKFTLTKPETVAAVQWTHDLAWKHKVTEVTTALTGGIDPGPKFWGRNVPLLFEGIHIFENIPEGLPFTWDVAPPPQGPCGRGQRASIDGFAIYSRAKNPDEAWTVVQDLTSTETMRMRQEEVGLVASRKSVASEWPKLFPEKNLKSLVDTMNDAQPDPLSLWHRSAEVWNGVKGTVEQMMILNTLPVPDGLAKMQADIEQIYKS